MNNDEIELKLIRQIGNIGDDICEEAEIFAQRGKRRRRLKPRTVLIAAAVLIGALALTLGAIAASTYDFGFYFTQRFGGDTATIGEMTEAVRNVRYNSSNDDVRLEITGVTGDSNYTYVWFDLILPQGDYEGIYPRIENFDFNFSTEFFSSYSLEYSCGYLSERKADNIFSFFCIASANGKIQLPGRRVKLSVENISAYNSDFLIEGKWTAKFSLNYPDLTQEFEPDISGQVIETSEAEVDGKTPGIRGNYNLSMQASYCKISVSQISMKLRFGYEAESSQNYLLPYSVTLLLDDGREVICNSKSGGSYYKADVGRGEYYVGFVFSEPISPEHISAIVYGGVTIPLCTETTQ